MSKIFVALFSSFPSCSVDIDSKVGTLDDDKDRNEEETDEKA